jgi:lysozyme family protein
MTFQEVFERIISIEGDYVNDPNDPGKETKYGISKRAYPNLIIKDLTREDAFNIYKRDFWNVIRGDSISSSVAYQLFDFAVNSGIQVAIRYLQRAIGVADDGYFGPVSINALQKAVKTNVIFLLLSERLDYMTRLSKWDEFGRGWARRIALDLKYAAQDN